jgi:hypothetical protein
MKKPFFLLLLIAGVVTSNAQSRKPDSGSIKKGVVNRAALPEKLLKTEPVTTTTSSGSNNLQKTASESTQQTQTTDNTQYIITGATVTIKTGSDSKEYPSKVHIYLFPMPAPTYTYTYTLGQLNMTNAMNVNSSTDFGLTPMFKQQIPWPVYHSSAYNGTNKASNPYTSGNKNWMLSDLLQQGFRLLIAYRPNIALDAWEIKQVTVKLHIEKADHTPHPTLNNKTIVFNITSPLLGVPTGMALVCEADKNFMPATHYLSKDILID